jgi:hypothetical protein
MKPTVAVELGRNLCRNYSTVVTGLMSGVTKLMQRVDQACP